MESNIFGGTEVSGQYGEEELGQIKPQTYPTGVEVKDLILNLRQNPWI